MKNLRLSPPSPVLDRRQWITGTSAMAAALALSGARVLSQSDSLGASPGAGKDRALVLGGGGEYFAAWMMGFMQGLEVSGVPTEQPEVIVGTSAGSLVGSVIAGGHLRRLTREFEFFGEFPKLLSALVAVPSPNPSQLRAIELCRRATDARVLTIQGIGRGAMAAKNPEVAKLQKMIGLLTGDTEWPDPKFHAVTIDCYTGERLVISSTSRIPVTHAVSASMSLPGIFGPTWVGDRLCMDGGMSASSTHSDLVVGARRAVVISLTDGVTPGSPRFSNIPNDLQRELKYVESKGTKTLLIAANPGKVDLISPDDIAAALKAGHERGVKESAAIKAFWA